jgi:cysteine synthase B
MITRAIERGDLADGKQIIEATSGNTGIALAMIAALKKIPITLLMPESATEERKQSMRAYGATLILTDGDKGIEHSRKLAEEMAASGDYYMLNQFGNADNPDAHYHTTGPEIWNDTDQKITHFVSSMGTTGTIMGTSRYLKEQNPNIKIIGVQPEEGSRIPGIRKWSPEMVPTICDFSRVDEIRHVNVDQATAMTRRLSKEEGIMAGMSSGGSTTVGLQIANEIDSGIIVCIICDRGDRYLSSGLFE